MNKTRKRTVLVTGGSGFIGSCLVRHLIASTRDTVINLDKLTYAADPAALESVASNPRHRFFHGDICDHRCVAGVLEANQPDAVIHLAAESHVDRSIDGPAEFIQTNIVGTSVLLQEVLKYWRELDESKRRHFRFHHVSTDEVYGELGPTGAFVETTPYAPSSPYSASKAASDHLVRAWHATYGLPVVITNCSNNYGPFQFPEKLVPLIITKALTGQQLPIYGDGSNVRDWLFVEDHAQALDLISREGVVGETYNIGGDAERTNLEVAGSICDLVDELAGILPTGLPRRSLITFVGDRPGHDFRYAMDFTKLKQSLDWRPAEGFESGLRKTVRWYLDERGWWEGIIAKRYDGHRLGVPTR